MIEKAFPNPHRTDELGMTLRDYFAAQSFASMTLGTSLNAEWYEKTAIHAYAMADAMMKAREA